MGKEEDKDEGMVDIMKLKMQGDSDMGDLIGSGKNIGQMLGNIFTVLEHGDRIKHGGSDYAKMIGTTGMVIGSIVDGIKEAKEYHAKELRLPSEVNTQIKGQIKELEAAKENVDLQKKLEELSVEVMKIPTKKLPDNKEDLTSAIESGQKDIEKLRKKLAKIEKKKN